MTLAQSTNRSLWHGTAGDPKAEIVIVGEAWGEQEAHVQQPFIGSAGDALMRLLGESNLLNLASITRAQREQRLSKTEARSFALGEAGLLLTNVIAERPPNNDFENFLYPQKTPGVQSYGGLLPKEKVLLEMERLHEQIMAHPRKLVICVGNYALWACLRNSTGYTTSSKFRGVRTPTGIMNYRGTMNFYTPLIKPECTTNIPLLPIVHPSAMLRQWGLRPVILHDLRTRVPLAKNNEWSAPAFNINSQPTWIEAQEFLHALLDNEPRWITNDIETARNLITCCGIGTSPTDAIVIPFIRLEGKEFKSYWPLKQEAVLVQLLGMVLERNFVIGQNYLYDIQWEQRDFGITPNVQFDTQTAQHVLLPGTPKSLLYLSSIYCRHHRFWKDDNSHWEAKGDWATHLNYNGEDCCRTFEIFDAQREVISNLGLSAQFEEQMELERLALRMMNRGVKIDTARRARLLREVQDSINERLRTLNRIIPHDIAHHTVKSKTSKPWYTSPAQQQWVFGELLGLSIPKSRKTGRPSLDAESLNKLRLKAPYLGKLFDLLEELRSLGVFMSTFIRAPLDVDNRMRCRFKSTGAETFRWASAKNDFGTGANLQNIPVGTED